MAVATGVKSIHPDYHRLLPKWRKARDVVAGQDAIHAAGTLYLDLLRDEDPFEYLKRLRRTPFFNASFRTVASFVGMMFRKPPVLDVPEALKPLLEDVTMSGISFENLAQNVSYENMTVSRLGIFVDHPPKVEVGEGSVLTQADAEKLGLRPSMTMYNAESITNWEYRRINNKMVLSQVRLKEVETIKLTEFEYQYLPRIRVLDLEEKTNTYRVRVFDGDTEEQIGFDVYPEMDGKPLDEIPFYFIGADGTDGAAEDPILIDLFEHNIKHYQVSADYEHACHMTALPTPWVTGYAPTYDLNGVMQKAEFYIGSTTAWVFPDPLAKVGFLEYNGQGIAAIKANLDDKKEEMASLGARALAPDKSGVESANTLVTRNTGENGIVGASSIAISRGLTNALTTFAKWASIAGKCKFELNRDFIPFAIDPASLTAWLALVQAGKMTDEELFDLLQRGDLVDPEVDFEAHQATIDANPPMPAPLAPGQLPPGAPPPKPGDPAPKPAPKPKPKPPVAK